METDPMLICPRCGARGHFHRAEIQERGNGLAMFLLGGMWAYLLSRPNSNMYLCDHCHYVFEPDPRINKWVALGISLFCAFMLIVLICVVISAH